MLVYEARTFLRKVRFKRMLICNVRKCVRDMVVQRKLKQSPSFSFLIPAYFLCCLEFDLFLFLFVPLSPTSILPSPFFPSLISLVVSVDLRYHVYLLTYPPYPPKKQLRRVTTFFFRLSVMLF